MTSSQPLSGFRAVFTTVGATYIALASSMLIRGVVIMHDFGLPSSVVGSPFFEDFFLFFYQLMALLGALMILFGWTVRARRDQQWVAGAFVPLNLLIMLRDLSTSDSRFGNRLYQGEGTLAPVVISLVFALAFAGLLLAGLRRRA